MMMSTSSAPPLPGGSGAFTLAAWNIRCGRNAGLTSAAKGLVQMGVGLAVVTETTITDARYTRLTSGHKILASRAGSHNQGGIALLWKEDHQGFEVESAKILTPNLLTFQLVTGDERFYCMGIYLPPTDTMGVEDLLSRRLHAPCLGRFESQFQRASGRTGRGYSQSHRRHRPCRRVEKIRTSATTQTINPSEVDLAAEEGGEAALLAAGLCYGAQRGLQVILERRVPMAAISRLGPPSRRRDHKIGEEETQGELEEAPGIPAAITPRGAAG